MTFINDDGQQLMHSYNVIIGRLIANNGKEFKVMMIIVYCACFAHYSCLSIFTYSWEEGYNFWVPVCNVCYVLIAFCLSVRINVFDSLFFFFFFFFGFTFFLLEIFVGVSINILLNKSTSVIYVYFKFHISYLWAIMRPYHFSMIWIQAFGVWGVDIENLACLLL